MRPEPELEVLLKEIQGILDMPADYKHRLDSRKMPGTIAMVSLLEWALGAQGDKTRDSLVKLFKAELAAAVRHANR